MNKSAKMHVSKISLIFFFPADPLEQLLFVRWSFTSNFCFVLSLYAANVSSFEIEGKAMIRNRYNCTTPPINDIKGKETQTRNN